MKIKQVRLKEFRRFTNLTITDIPQTTRLVVLVGPNGAGKSSVFDAFNTLATVSTNQFAPIADYYTKSGSVEINSHWDVFEREKVTIEFFDSVVGSWQDKTKEAATRFYLRTGYRYEPDFNIKSIAKQGDASQDSSKPTHMMSLENRVSSNFQRIVAQTVADVFDTSKDESMTKEQLRERLIGKIRMSFARVLPDAEFVGPGNPLVNGSFFFDKGTSKGWAYKNLSAGEKATFDLVLDFVVKSETFNNTIYCIDEPEVHVNTNVHGALLQELYNSLPNQSQLWIATHSAGMMRKAQELEAAHPGTVVFLDFGCDDFDQPVTLRPAVTNRAFWQRNFKIAIGDMAHLIAPNQIFFCEGDPKGVKKKEFDAQCYSAIFGDEFPDTVFLSVGSSSEVKDKAALLGGVFSQFLPNVRTTYVVDRDDCTEAERLAILAQGNKILTRRHLEAYLLDDEILEKLCLSQGKSGFWPTLQSQKATFMSNSMGRGNPSDDWKSVGENIRVEVKKLLGINQVGSNADAFILSYLVPLITPDTKIYQELKNEIFY